jgi:glycine oxidase
MKKADSPSPSAGQSSVGLLIVGGGIMGLWAAVEAEQRGIDTVLIEAGTLGSGASGGLLGALMPYMPDKWDQKKQFQLDSLLALESRIAALEAATGLSSGYRRSGRYMPLPKPHLRTIALRHEQDALANWTQGDRRFFWHVRDTPGEDGWLDPAIGAAGVVLDTLAARVSPRGLCAVLAAFLQSARHVRIVENVAVDQIDPQAGKASLSNDEDIKFGHCIVSAGHQSFPFLQAASAPADLRLGWPVKGQSALLKADVDPALPVIFLGGIYIVPHEHGTVAIGSTSEEQFAHPFSTDQQLDTLIARAAELVPSLRDTPVLERWAGLRPKAVDRDPMVGPHPDHPRLLALTGGFKVSFGLAHHLAAAALRAVEGEAMDLPPGFTLDSHLAVAASKT